MSWNLDITIDDPFGERVPEAWLRHIVEQVLQTEGVEATCELSLLITGDTTVHELNQRYRQVGRTTDVLAFAFQEDEDFPSGPEGMVHLGEVIISLPQAEQQAKEQEHPLEKELVILVIHGVLHLLGYDHENQAEEAEMGAREAEILAKIEF